MLTIRNELQHFTIRLIKKDNWSKIQFIQYALYIHTICTISKENKQT